MVQNTAHAAKSPRLNSSKYLHLAGWIFLALCLATQPFGLLSTDTKLDLTTNPGGFLAGALQAWTDNYPLGQLQNQAYGYLFPQGLFFLIGSKLPLPMWVVQRLWWLLVLGIGYSGILFLARPLRLPRWALAFAGILYALSPHTLSTLSTISSETWPLMLSPWVVGIVLRGTRTPWLTGMIASIPIALMGAVNATATLAAAVPGALVILWLIWQKYPGAGKVFIAWILSSIAVSTWWIGPLLILGKYSPPFIDFIESAFITTRWLNLAELLRGTTSWVPFVDLERQAGWWLVSEPAAIIFTLGVATCGLLGLYWGTSSGAAGAAGSAGTAGTAASARGGNLSQLWIFMLLVGLAIMGAGWALPAIRDFLDGAGSPLRNVHKFDALIRLPLCIGVAILVDRIHHLGQAQQQQQQQPQQQARWGWRGQPTRATALIGVVFMLAAGQISPAWTSRLLPEGTYAAIPEYWQQAADFLNKTAGGTRTLIYPPASFARQEWGWTRDEPLQPLLEVPWVTRDAIPLVNTEAIRGLDGLMGVLAATERGEIPLANTKKALLDAGLGALILRENTTSAATLGRLGEVTAFGPVQVVILDPVANRDLVASNLPKLAGGGESIALLRAVSEATHVQLTANPDTAQIISDTPQAVIRNYGTLQGAVSAPLIPGQEHEGGQLHHRYWDYPSAASPLFWEQIGGQVRASSQAAAANNFGGAQSSRSINAAIDGHLFSAWHPARGTGAGQWLELQADAPTDGQVEIMSTTDTAITVETNDISLKNIELKAYKLRSLQLPPGSTRVRVILSAETGIAQLRFPNHPIKRTLTLKTNPVTTAILLQRLFPEMAAIDRQLDLNRELKVVLKAPSDSKITIDSNSYAAGETVILSPGLHQLSTRASWVYLEEIGTTLAAPGTDLLVSQRAANPGLKLDFPGAFPRTIDAGIQAFELPFGTEAASFAALEAALDVPLEFGPDKRYQKLLLGGGIISALVLLGAILAAYRLRRLPSLAVPELPAELPAKRGTDLVLGGVILGVASLLGSWPGVLIVLAVFGILRFTLIKPALLISALLATTAMWLARAPWPAEIYAGDAIFTQLLLLGALAALVFGRLFR
ncbi:alpha-(1-_3)-arabinofuranosyltransferase domain-containing protein [Corynebacterium caspium]|uniref:alpha-(1->3)-arabinofuranosyltransferase domain-containing protein n=1 Tax=Corynebacterium caspium TaxID=234828 RepID=UPI00036AE7C8|nr:alpha-(1->3)-arabinofuranosyltransferase family protein [Corynebacterium caspium]WKD59954.1 Alpha-(1->3)-arabinofuranosyltransferase [Corynebacterium caspium DSM 44850]